METSNITTTFKIELPDLNNKFFWVEQVNSFLHKPINLKTFFDVTFLHRRIDLSFNNSNSNSSNLDQATALLMIHNLYDQFRALGIS